VIYLDKHLVLYSPLEIDFKHSECLDEAKTILDRYGAWISSKGVQLEKPDLSKVSLSEADKIERESRQTQRDQRPDDFPVKGVLLRGIKGLNYSFSYLVTDTSHYEWTPASLECPILCSLVESFQFDKLGRVNIQTVEAGMSLHKHIDSVFRMDKETISRRRSHLKQYGLKKFNMDVDCLITVVLQGDSINFHFTRSEEKVSVNDSCYYFRPDLIHHSVDKSDTQRIICRIEGKASTKMIDWIQDQAAIHSEKVIVI